MFEYLLSQSFKLVKGIPVETEQQWKRKSRVGKIVFCLELKYNKIITFVLKSPSYQLGVLFTEVLNQQ